MAGEGGAGTRPSDGEARAAAPRTGRETVRTWGRRARRWARRAVAFTTKAVGTLLVVWIMWLLGYELLGKHRIEIEAIGVPRSLIRDGFSAEVATRRLQDALKAIADRAQTTMKKADVQVGQTLPDITIPAAGVSVAGMAASIRRLLPEGWRHEVSGEFTASGGQLALRLRENESVVFQGKASDSDVCHGLIKTNPVDSLINRGALKLVEKIEPFIAAVYYHEVKCDKIARALADHIIISLPSDDENVSHAYNMKGIFAWQRGDYREALEYLEAAKGLSLSLSNLGDFFAQLGRYGIALAAFREALRLDHGSAEAHLGIAKVWDATRLIEGTAGLPREEVLTDPQFGLTTVAIGFWNNYGTVSESIAEYRRAIWLDPTLSDAHYYLGDIYRKQGNLDDAAAEYREAIRVENAHTQPGSDRVVEPYVNLANALLSQGRRVEAIDYFREAIRADPKHASLHYELGITLRDLARSTNGSEELNNLQDACTAFEQASALAAEDRDYRAWLSEFHLRVAETDAMLVALSAGLD